MRSWTSPRTPRHSLLNPRSRPSAMPTPLASSGTDGCVTTYPSENDSAFK